MNKRQIALKRAESLRDTIADYLKAKESIPAVWEPPNRRSTSGRRPKSLPI